MARGIPTISSWIDHYHERISVERRQLSRRFGRKRPEKNVDHDRRGDGRVDLCLLEFTVSSDSGVGASRILSWLPHSCIRAWPALATPSEVYRGSRVGALGWACHTLLWDPAADRRHTIRLLHGRLRLADPLYPWDLRDVLADCES